MKKIYSTKIPLGSLLCLLTVTAGCCINLGWWPQEKYQKTEQLQAPLEPGSALDVKTAFGSITITGADVNQCSVIADISAQAPTKEEAQEIAEKVKIKLEPAGKTLTITAEKPHVKENLSISVSFKITTPRQTGIECSTSFGSIKLTNIEGNIKSETSFAPINAEDIQGELQLKTSYGSITCRNIVSTSLRAKTSFSSIKCENVQGPAQLETSYGSIKCRDFTSADIAAQSSFGSIDIECSPSTSAEMSADVATSYGSIEFVTPPKFSGEVDLETSYGSITTNLPIALKGQISKNKIEGAIGDGKGKLHLKTSFGSITLR